jgi:hypothetical protein
MVGFSRTELSRENKKSYRADIDHVDRHVALNVHTVATSMSEDLFFLSPSSAWIGTNWQHCMEF